MNIDRVWSVDALIVAVISVSSVVGVFLFGLNKMVIVAVQATLAAIAEERVAITADRHGFRNKDGEFKSKIHASVKSLLGVGLIAVVVLFYPIIARNFFKNIFIQSVGVGLIGSVVLIHVAVDKWKMNKASDLKNGDNIEDLKDGEVTEILNRARESSFRDLLSKMHDVEDLTIMGIGLLLIIAPYFL